MRGQEKRFEFVPFLINLVIPLIFGAFASLFRSQVASAWYISLNKPQYYPSFTASGLARSLLTFTIGIAAFLIWRRRKTIKHYATVIIFYFLQLVLNFLWAYAFFNKHWIIVSLIIVITLVLTAIWNTIVFYRIHRPAGLLFTIYLVWILLIAYLTIGVFYLN